MSTSPESQSGWGNPLLPGGTGFAFCPAARSSAAFRSFTATTPSWSEVTSRPLIPIPDEWGMNLVRGSEGLSLRGLGYSTGRTSENPLHRKPGFREHPYSAGG
jgi:hypothetical protein